MGTAILYMFIFSTWGLGLLTWMVGLGAKAKMLDLEQMEKMLEISQKKLLFNHFNSGAKISGRHPLSSSFPPASMDLPEKLKELMKSSPDHPEVNEIDGSDEIVGVKFEAGNYPPGFGDIDDDE